MAEKIVMPRRLYHLFCRKKIGLFLHILISKKYFFFRHKNQPKKNGLWRTQHPKKIIIQLISKNDAGAQ